MISDQQQLIKASNLRKTYGKGSSAFEALKGVNLQVAEGESVAILGKSGSGKSTLMHLLAGLDRPSSGDILYAGVSLAKMSERELSQFRNQNVGFIFQQFYLQPTLTVLENVILPLKIAGVGVLSRKKKALEALAKVGLTDKAGNRATDLSGGQKQRVAIARALVTNPKVVFADEPTGNLDTETANDVVKQLQILNKEEGITLVVVTHDSDLAKLCQKQVRIQDGMLV